MLPMTLLVLKVLLLHLVIVEVVVGRTDADCLPLSRRLLLLDVDNTLYRDDSLGSGGIESQIVKNIHSYFDHHDRVKLSKQECDDLHMRYGSTIEGVRQLVPKASLPRVMQDFYRQVYENVDVSALLRLNTISNVKTGYTHQHQRQLQRNLLRSLACQSPDASVMLASNSPFSHVCKVVQALGLTRICNDRENSIMTPDYPVRSVNDPSQQQYPTKLSKEYYQPIFQAVEVAITDNIMLLDDSQTTLQYLKDNKLELPIQIKGYEVSQKQSFDVAMARALGWIDDEYIFSQVKYLQEKNKVDYESINSDTWALFCANVAAVVASGEEVVIVDVGAGLLSMLTLVLEGTSRLSSLVNSMPGTVKHVHYYAYEPNQGLESACIQNLKHMGFTLESSRNWNDSSRAEKVSKRIEHTFVRSFCSKHLSNTNNIDRSVTVSLRLWDYTLDKSGTDDNNVVKSELTSQAESLPIPHCIIGCCFADLLDPEYLVSSLLGTFMYPKRENDRSRTKYDHTIVYFPITFAGVTQFSPAMPVDADNEIPSDTVAFRKYSEGLVSVLGHFLDNTELTQAVLNHGGTLVSAGRSTWVISHARDTYMWHTMLYFFGLVAAPQLHLSSWNASAWLKRAKDFKSDIRVTNQDLLYQLPHMGAWRPCSFFSSNANRHKNRNARCDDHYEEIQFVSPCKVTTVKKQTKDLAKNEVRIATVRSLISSGTELKIFTGLFDDDGAASLDVNIEGMKDAKMEYPLSYGYCLVGYVVECGDNVTDRDSLLGKLVFTFAAHASQVITDRSAIQIVPRDIDADDAIFMPSVETALSIVHDACPILGEDVAVFGQGLIGLLVTSLLQSMYFSNDGTTGTITTFDTVEERLAMSAYLGSHQALSPKTISKVGMFDVAIEASGNGRALQSAIDYTKNGGRIVVASWYGDKPIDIKLGINFHRSHKTLTTSQVSELPARLRETWSKERRFALTWNLVRLLKPSRLLTRSVPLHEAQQAYEALQHGKEIAISFLYK